MWYENPSGSRSPTDESENKRVGHQVFKRVGSVFKKVVTKGTGDDTYQSEFYSFVKNLIGNFYPCNLRVPSCSSLIITDLCQCISVSFSQLFDLLENWKNGLTTGLLSVFLHVTKCILISSRFPDHPWGSTPSLITFCGVMKSIQSTGSLPLDPRKHIVHPFLHTFWEAAKSITVPISFLGFYIRKDIVKILSVSMSGFKPFPLWFVPFMVNFYYIVLILDVCNKKLFIPTIARNFTCKSQSL